MSTAKLNDYEEYLRHYLRGTSNLAILLDYDGTLSPIAPHPDLAVLPPETKNILERLSQIPNVFLAIISGRGVSNVKNLVGLNITYAGNHGLEVLYPDGSSYNHQLPTDYGDRVRRLVARLERTVVRDGAWIENKGASLTFHFRATPENLRPEMEETAFRLMEEEGFKVGRALCGLEARPKVDWNKGSVALMLLTKKYGEEWRKNAKVVFAGDDTTDEDAIKALKGSAATFRIAANGNVQTYAEKLISSTEHVVKILQLIEQMLRSPDCPCKQL